MQDFEDILEMFEDYKRDPRPMDQEPRNMAQGGRIGFENGLSAKLDKSTDMDLLGRLQSYNDEALQKSSQALYDKYGKDVVDAASIEKFGVPHNKFKPQDDPKGNKRSNFRLKFESDMKKYGKYISPAESASVGANKRSLDNAKIKLNIIEATKEGAPLNVEQFTKDNDITVKELKKQTKTLQKNIYIKRSLVSGKDSPNKLLWLTDDLTATDNVLKTLTKQKLIINDVDSIDNIMFNAFGREFEAGTTNIKNPNYNIEKYSAIQKNLSEYRLLNKYIDKTYGIKTELDHPLSKKIIRQLMNGTAEELSRVNILEKNLNQQFKNQLNINYLKAVDSGNIKQKRAVEKIAEKFKLNIGSVPDDQFFDVSKIDRGALSFEKLDIKKEMVKSLKNAASLDTEFLKYIKENPGVFEDAQINISKIVKPKNVANIANKLPEIIDYIDGKKDFVGVNSGFNTDLLMKDPLVKKLLNSKSGQAVAKTLRGTTGALGKVFGGVDVILGVVDYENNISKGQSEKEALQNAFQAMSINMYKGGDRARTEEVKKFFVKNGGDGKIFDQVTALNTKDQEINDLIYKSKSTADKASIDLSQPQATLGKSLNQRKEDYGILKNQLNKKIASAIEDRDGLARSYKTNLQVSEAGAPISIGNKDFFSKPFQDTKRAAFDKIKSDNAKSYDMQKRQLNFTSGNAGNFLQNNIFTMDPIEKSKQQKLINEMDERELYKFNLQRGMDPDNLVRAEDVLRYSSTSPDIMGVNTTKYVNYDDRKARGGIMSLTNKK